MDTRVYALSNKNGLAIFSWEVSVVSKGCMWVVAASVWAVTTSVWDFSATMGIVAGDVWAVAASV